MVPGMSARKKSGKTGTPIFPPAMVNLFRMLTGPGRWAVSMALVLALFLGGWYYVWNRVRQRVLSSDQYVLTPRDVEMTPLPDWIHADIRAEVFRDASLDGGLSIMDEDLCERIAGAFSMHPWVAKVRSVRRSFPGRVEVELVYRRPVCMVEVPDGLLPVDAEGVLLPRGDFSPVEAGRYPRLAGIRTVPVGPVGTRWGDGHVIDGAAIAAAFGPTWGELKLDRIVPAASLTAYSPETTYELFTTGGTRILWGRGPASTMPSELPAVDKVARLKRYATEHGSLDAPDGPQVLDIKMLGPLPGDPRTTNRSASPLR